MIFHSHVKIIDWFIWNLHLAGFGPSVFLLLIVGCAARPFYPLPSKVDARDRLPLQTSRPYNVAHRGSNGELPEETAAAYMVCAQCGVWEFGKLICSYAWFAKSFIDDEEQKVPIKNRQKRKIGEEQKAITLFKLSKQKVHESAQLRDTRKTKYTQKKKRSTFIHLIFSYLYLCRFFYLLL